MNRLAPSVAACVFGLVLAGCAAPTDDTSSSQIASFDDLGGHATDTTGLIRGVVVDLAVVPIAKAAVSISGPSKHNLTADAQGRFLIDGLDPGTYIVTAKAPLFHDSSTTVDVVAGVNEPAVTKVQLTPLFSQKPFTLQDKKRGYFDCSQYGAGIYQSSNCVTDQCPIFFDPAQCNQLPTRMMDNVTSQTREWHMDVGPGWQNIIFEMTWQSSSVATGKNLHMTVSTYKPLRDPGHWFASWASSNPFLLRLDVGVKHPTAQIPSGTPEMIPAEGMNQVSYFVSSAPDSENSFVPAIALQQDFDVVWTTFYYGIAPPGWSFVHGDKRPY